MDVLLLSRFQFAAATMFHFIFVPLTIGLTILIACMETAYVRSGNKIYQRMAKFWGKLFLVNFSLGIVTGITLEFQFGTNWARYSTYVGDIFGPLLAIEATAAFFLESTFIGAWIFGWERLSAKGHAIVAWLVALAGNLSAIWIIYANGFMQNPVGYVMRNGRAELESFSALLTNPYALAIWSHTITAAFALSCFFILGVSSYHLIRKNEVEFFTKSFNLGAKVGFVAMLLLLLAGHQSGQVAAKYQPAKLAAMEAHWETGTNVPMYLIAAPNTDGTDGNMIEALPIPSLMSIMAFNDPNAEVIGLNDIPVDERPNVPIVFYAFRIMVAIGSLMFIMAALAMYIRKKPENHPRLLKAFLFFIPLPYIAIDLGWVVTEVGRQPWIVYGMMKTSDAVSVGVSTGAVGFSLVFMILLYSLLGTAGIWLIANFAKKGPVRDA